MGERPWPGRPGRGVKRARRRAHLGGCCGLEPRAQFVRLSARLEKWNGQKLFELTAREICQQIAPPIAESIDDSFATKEYRIDQLQSSSCIRHDVARPNVGAAPELKPSSPVRKQREQAGAKGGEVGVSDASNGIPGGST
jgi:hypothetical protein